MKWRSDGFKSPKESKCQTKIPVWIKQVPNSWVSKIIMQRTYLATILLLMFLMVSSFKEKFKNQTSKCSKQMYSFLRKFTSEISHRSMTP